MKNYLKGSIVAATFLTRSWDLSENRMNSFPKPDQALLERIHEPLRIEAHLAAEDPRRVDLERQALSKLRRVLRRDDREALLYQPDRHLSLQLHTVPPPIVLVGQGAKVEGDGHRRGLGPGGGRGLAEAHAGWRPRRRRLGPW